LLLIEQRMLSLFSIVWIGRKSLRRFRLIIWPPMGRVADVTLRERGRRLSRGSTIQSLDGATALRPWRPCSTSLGLSRRRMMTGALTRVRDQRRWNVPRHVAH